MKTILLAVVVVAIVGAASARPDVAKISEKPAEKPAEVIVEKIAEKPVEKPMENPVEKQSEIQSEKAVVQPSAQPSEQSKVQPNAQEEKYTIKYDNVDLDEILKSDRLLKGYHNCLMETASCTPDGEELRRLLPDALHTGCSKCSERQREGARKVIHYLIEHKRDMWNELEAKYDKEGEYRRKYQSEIEKEGLKL